MHKVLIELQIASTKSFHSLRILVKLPVSFIDDNLVPFFWPELKDEMKYHGESWQDDLESIHDPAHKFTYVSKSQIVPERASEFVKMRLSSDTVTNATRIFAIAENDFREKTGNVTIFSEISAFNQNFSVFNSMEKLNRRSIWRWRRATYGFNLTVVHPEKELTESSSNICEKKFVADYKK